MSLPPRARLHHLGGEGDPIILIHGFGADRFGWAANAPFLMPKASVYAVELPGHGSASVEVGDGSVAVLAEAVAAEIGAVEGPKILAGHSLGGRVAAELSKNSALEIRHTVLISPAGFGPKVDAEFVKKFPELNTQDEALALLLRLVERKSMIKPAMADHLLSFLNAPGRREGLRTIGQQILELKPEAWSQEKMTIFWGAQDAIASAPDPSISDLQVNFLPNAGHLGHVEAASKVNAAILAALTAA